MKDHGLSRQLLALLLAMSLAACGGGGSGVTDPPATPSTDPPANPAAAATSVTIDKPLAFFSVNGQSMQLAAQPLDAQGAVVPGVVSWTSSAPDRIAVDASGRVVALATGSAQIVAQVGAVRSAPTLAIVALPQPGAVLLTDAQVVSVGPPLGLAPGDAPGVGTQYEVTLRGVAAPAPGTAMLGIETAPIAGKVVATRQEAAGLIVTLAIAPLYQLLRDYDLNFDIDLSTLPFEAVPDPATPVVKGAPVWVAAQPGRARALAQRQALEDFKPFRAFKCDPSIDAKLPAKAINLTLDNQLTLLLNDRPGYTKHALAGSAKITGSAGFTLEVGFAASGHCKAQGQIKFPVFGWFSVLVMPGVRFGLGAEVKGEVHAVQGELGVTGSVGISPVLGWECGGATPACRGLNEIPLSNEFKTKSRMPTSHDLQADVSAQFYVIAGLDAVVALGASNIELVEARIGPKQSFNLAFEDDQAARRDYASHYKLDLVGVVQPGSGLKKAIEKVIGDDSTTINLSLGFTEPLSESPKGSLSVNKTKVRPGTAVDFTLDLRAETTVYKLLGYNVLSLQLYRKRDDQTEFTFWKFMDQIATNKATYRWEPTDAEVGTYDIAAFVETQIPELLLEVSENSVRTVEVGCALPGAQAAPTRSQALALNGARVAPLANSSCPPDSWVGSASYIAKTPGLPTANIASRSTITWNLDPATSGNGATYYTASGSFDLAFNHPDACVSVLTPNVFTIVNDPLSPPRLGLLDNGFIAPTYGFGGIQSVDFTATTTCPGRTPTVSEFRGFQAFYATGSGPYTPGQATLAGSIEDAATSATWSFSRP